MAAIMYGQEGDDIIITRIDFGRGDEYLVEVRNGAGYFAVYSTFDYEKAFNRVAQMVKLKREETGYEDRAKTRLSSVYGLCARK